jgi:plastocyanin
MTRRVAVLAAFLATTAASAPAQNLTYAKGQNVSPAYEGWEEDSAGRRFFVFGYMNRNWQEEVDVPVGADNKFLAGAADQGQPTHFLPRRNRFIFRVPVPAGFTEKDELVWSLTTKGKTELAYASLKLDLKLDDVVKASETGALGAGSSSPEVRANTPPVLEIQGPRRLEVKVGQAVTLTTMVKDDGLPKVRLIGAGAAVENEGSSATLSSNNPVMIKQVEALRARRLVLPPARVTVGKNVGLWVGWHVYRGAGKVTFDKDQIATWEDTRTGGNSPWAPHWRAPELPTDGKTAVTATFHAPGEYVLRSRADDGALTSDQQVIVVVKP